MDNLINDFSQFVKQEFDLDVKPNELKKTIGNNAVMFKTFQIIMLKFKNKQNGEIIRRKLEIDKKRSKLNELANKLNEMQNDLLDLIKVIDERKSTIKKGKQLKEFYEFKELRVKQLIKLLEQILKSNDQEIDTTANLDKIDKNINMLNTNLNLDNIDKYLPTSQSNYNLVEKQIDEFIKDINGSIYEITSLMKNEDFILELNEENFIEKLTKTDYKLDFKPANENIETKHTDKRLMKLTKHYESYKERTENLYNKHKSKVFDLIKKVEEQTSAAKS